MFCCCCLPLPQVRLATSRIPSFGDRVALEEPFCHPSQHLFLYVFPNPRTLSSTLLFLAKWKEASLPVWKEGFRQLRLQLPGLVAVSGRGQLSFKSLKRVELRGRGVPVGLLGGHSPSFCGGVLRSGNTGAKVSLPTGLWGASLAFGEAAEQRC